MMDDVCCMKIEGDLFQHNGLRTKVFTKLFTHEVFPAASDSRDSQALHEPWGLDGERFSLHGGWRQWRQWGALLVVDPEAGRTGGKTME